MTFVAQRRAQHAREAALRRMQLRALWARWVDTAERKRGHALRVVRAQQSGWLAYGMHWMRKWRAYAARRARVERLQRRADVYRRSALGSRTLSLWRVTAVRVADLRRQMLERQAAVTRRVWGAWRTFVSERFELQRADLRAVRHFQQQLVRRKRGCLAEWQRFVRRRRAARQGQQRLAERVERARLSVPFAAWKQALLERVCRALRDERQHVNDMNIDNLNLTERLQQFQRQVSDLDTRLSAMSLKLQDAQSQARDSVTREQALQAQIDSLRHEAAAVYEQHALLRSKIGDTSDEAMSLRTQHALELSSQQQQIRSLNNQLDGTRAAARLRERPCGRAGGRGGRVRSCARVLMAALAESNRLVATLQEAIERLNAELAAKDRAAEAKLAQVFDVASSLRQMLEEKEHTIVTLAGEREQQDAVRVRVARWVGRGLWCLSPDRVLARMGAEVTLHPCLPPQ